MLITFCEPASPKVVRGLSGPSHNNLGHSKGRTTYSVAQNAVQCFVPVAAVGTAPFGNHLRKKMANGWILNRVGRERAVGPRLAIIIYYRAPICLIRSNSDIYIEVFCTSPFK